MTREHAAMPLVDLNTTPLIDVMLVLLIIFMIAAPTLAHRVRLPGPSSTPPATLDTERHVIGIEALGANVSLTLDGELVSRSALSQVLQAAGRLPGAQQPEFRIDAGGNARYEIVAGLLAEGQRVGARRVGLGSGD